MHGSIVVGVALGTSPVSSGLKEEFSLWLFYTIILAVLPLLLNYIVLMLLVTWKDWLSNYINLLKDGELFFFSTTLSATSLSKLEALPSVAVAGGGASDLALRSWVQVGLWLILIMSTSFFGVCTYSKINRKLHLKRRKSIVAVSDPNIWGIAFGSILCAVASGLLSYMVYSYGGV